MDAKTYFKRKKFVTNYCNKGNCFDNQSSDCPLSIMNNGMFMRCSVLEQCYPEVAGQLILDYIEKEIGLREACEQMKLMRDGKIPKKVYGDFMKELEEENE